MRNSSILAVDNLGQLLEGGALGLDVHEVNEGELESDPALDFDDELVDKETKGLLSGN